MHKQLKQWITSHIENWKITYDWTTHGSVKHTTTEILGHVAENEINGVTSANIVIVLLPGGHGTHTELGAAIATNKHIIMYSEDPSTFLPGDKTCAFYQHHLVTTVSGNLENLLNHLRLLNKKSLSKTLHIELEAEYL